MDALLHESELSFAKGVFDIIVIVETRIAYNCLNCLNPLFFFLLCKKIVSTLLFRWKDQLEGVESSGAVQMLFGFILDENTDKVVHSLVLVFVFVSVNI
jgi:hypothetical protein